MNLYRKEWKIFLRTIYLPLILLAAFAFYQYQHISYALLDIRHSYPAEGLMAVFRSHANLIFLFAAMIFVGFELELRQRTRFPGDLLANGGAARVLGAKAALLATFALLFFCGALPYDLAMIIRVRVTTAAAVGNIICANILSYLFIPFVGGMMGLALGSLSGRLSGYAAMAVIFLVISPATGNFFTGLSHINPVLELPKKIFSFFTPNLTWFSTGLYGVPVEKQRWLLLLFWLAVSLAILLRGLWNRRRITAAALVCCCGVALFSFYGSVVDPGTLFHREEVELGILFTEENELAEQIANSYHRIIPTDEGEDFVITRYEGSLSVTDRLSGDLTLTVDRPLPFYRFTLAPGYKVSSVTDGAGNPTPFAQSGQFVTVTPEQPSATFRFVYSGNSPSHFANTQAIYLPGAFPYYPVAGVRRLGTYGSGPVSQDKAEFSVSVSALIPVHSNLSEQDGRFEGTAAAMTLYGGICEVKETDGFTEIWSPFYMPGGNLRRELLQEKITELCAELGIEEIRLPERFTVFRTEPTFPDTQPTYTADHIVADWQTNYNDMATQYVFACINPDGESYVKNSVLTALSNIIGGKSYATPELPDDILSAYSGEYGQFDLWVFAEERLAYYDAQYGRTELLKSVYDYLRQPQDYTSTMEYLMDLCGWQEHKEGLK